MPPTAPLPLSGLTLHVASLLLILLMAVHPANAESLDFTLPNLDNQMVRLTDFRGKWVIINFWASWCTPCILEMPELQTFSEAHRDRAVVIGVNFENIAPTEVRTLTQRLAITFPIVLSGGKLLSGFNLKGLPTTFLISPAGHLANIHLGTVSTAMLTSWLTNMEEQAGHSGSPPR
ncbi:MAG: TlpA disulfide reductase family protein [Candidatus Competibacteraceae bacterium]